MKIYLPFNFKENLRIFMQRAGYAQHQDFNTGNTSYTKRLSRDFYPRFHVYLEKDHNGQQHLNLHLDQKKPSYAGAHAHNADYEGENVLPEAKRLQGLIKNQIDNQAQSHKSDGENRGFWSKIFGG